MKIFYIEVPYYQQQLVQVEGYMNATILAETEEEALKIFHERRDEGEVYESENGVQITCHEDGIEVLKYYDYDFDMERLECNI